MKNRVFMFVLFVLLMWGSGFACAGPPIAYISCGSGSLREHPAGFPHGTYLDLATNMAPNIKARGITRLFLHNPAGQFPMVQNNGDGRGMRVDQWILAERVRLPHANREEFRAFVTLMKRAGVKEIIVYVGSPTQLLDPVKELPQVLEPFIDCGPIISFGFDAMFENGHGEAWQDLWAVGSKYRTAIANLRKSHKVYTEPRVRPEQLKAGLGKLVDGTIADAEFDAVTNYDLSTQPGEYMRATRGGNSTSDWTVELKDWPANVTPILRSNHNWGPLMPKVK